MAIDPPYRFDPFQNLVNVHWEEVTSGGYRWIYWGNLYSTFSEDFTTYNLYMTQYGGFFRQEVSPILGPPEQYALTRDGQVPIATGAVTNPGGWAGVYSSGSAGGLSLDWTVFVFNPDNFNDRQTSSGSFNLSGFTVTGGAPGPTLAATAFEAASFSNPYPEDLIYKPTAKLWFEEQ